MPLVLLTCLSSLLYGLVAWSSTFPTYLHNLASIQNKTVKLISEEHFSESKTQFYAKLKILKLLDLYKFKIAELVYIYINSKLPFFFSHYFKKACDVSNRSTRSLVNPHNLYKSLYCTERMQRNIKYHGIKIRNFILQTIQKLSNTFFR